MQSLTEAEDSSDGLRAILIRERLSDIRVALKNAGNDDWFTELHRLTGQALIDQFANGVDRICTMLNDSRENLPGATP